MSPATLDFAEAQWQMQLASMKAALSELKLPQKESFNVSGYGSDILFDDDEELTSGNSGDDVWDFITDSDEYLESNDIDEIPTPETIFLGYGPQWLKSKCIGFETRKRGLLGEDLQEQIMALLASDSVEEELQSTLTDIIGFDDLDFVIELISHRQEILAASPFSTVKDDGIFGRLQTKRQREEALRQRDYEHKHAQLGPAVHRDELQYPHVYKSHSSGNTLDSRGRKYALPVGSERKEHEASQFYSLTLNNYYEYFRSGWKFFMLTLYRDMKNILSLRQRWGLLGQDVSWWRSRIWTVFAGGLSRATSL